MTDDPTLDGRCGNCARFVRVTEQIDEDGRVRRVGDCLLGVWTSPLSERNTCSEYVKRGTFQAKPSGRTRSTRRAKRPAPTPAPIKEPISIPEELLSMDMDEFRNVLREVLHEELGVGDASLGGRWQGGEMILKPGKEGTAEKRIPIEALFHKIVMVRERLRVLEQKVNGHPKLTDEDKVQLQQYITQCYGSLTTFNVLFVGREDGFVGQRGEKDGD